MNPWLDPVHRGLKLPEWERLTKLDVYCKQRLSTLVNKTFQESTEPSLAPHDDLMLTLRTARRQKAQTTAV